jgi:chromate reductase
MPRVAGLSGSLREGSFNAALLRAARDLSPPGMEIDILSIDGLPGFNEDLEAGGYPIGVERLRARVEVCQAVLIATPEYNHGLPGVLKNALDWLSRGKDSPLKNKPLAMMGASSGKVGTARAQVHLRELGIYLGMPVLGGVEVAVGPAAPAFDAALHLTDDTTRDRLRDLLERFHDWTLQHPLPDARPTSSTATNHKDAP